MSVEEEMAPCEHDRWTEITTIDDQSRDIQRFLCEVCGRRFSRVLSATEQTYRLTRRHGALAAGAEIKLSEAEAIQLNNEAPGVIEGPIATAPEAKSAEPNTDMVAERRRVLVKESS